MDKLLAAINSIGKAVVHNQLEQEHINRRFEEMWSKSDDQPKHSEPHTPKFGAHDKPPPDSCWRVQSTRHSTSGEKESGSRFRMDPPRFDGSDPEDWIFRVEFYFDNYGATEAERLRYSVPLFDPPAAAWLRFYCANNPKVSWSEFLAAVRHRFDSGFYENYLGIMSHLQQTGSVLEYQTDFENMMTHIAGILEFALVAIYIGGLKHPLQKEVFLKQPQTLAEACAIARELASCHSAYYEQPPQQRRSWTPRETRFNATAAPTSMPTTASPGPVPFAGRPHQRTADFSPAKVTDPTLSKLPIVHLTAAQKAERTRLGLCWYCPEKWVTGHVCKHRFLAYMGDDDGEEGVVQHEDAPEEQEPLITGDILSVLSLAGSPSPNSLWMTGLIGSTTVQVLIDTGATHNFIHPALAEKLSLQLVSISPFRVYVGNGVSLICRARCQNTSLALQGNVFQVDIHVLDVHGPDIILRMKWLKSLRRVLTDYVDMTMDFTFGGRLVQLKGDTVPLREVSYTSLATLMSFRNEVDVYEVMQIQPEETPHTAVSFDIPADIPSFIRSVLVEQANVFKVPTGLPPARPFDHRIHLAPGSKPINVRPYRYPYFQENEIERQVREMLEQGIVQHSHNPFSSPVLLVRKKDGSFRFCINYRALNATKIPDHFPIPTTDELFDELGAARYFTKLDLRSGYHQIRMQQDDIFKIAFRTHEGHYEFLVMPFGLTNAPSTFQAAMNSIFQPFLRKL